MKKTKLFLLTMAAALMFGLSACGSNTGSTTVSDTNSDTTMADKSKNATSTESSSLAGDEVSEEFEAAGWKFTYEDVEIDTTFENISQELGYTSVNTSEFKKEASDGKMFCMIKLNIEKEDSTENVEWDKVKLVDNNGNEYERIDDSFISDLGMKRLPGTDLNFGSNDGWICYEVNDDAKTLTLTCAFKSETLEIKVK